MTAAAPPPDWSDGWVKPAASCHHDGARLVWVDTLHGRVMVCSKSGWEAGECAEKSS